MVKNYESHKDEIIRLYQNHNLDDVVKMMNERGFRASRRWYLSMFAKWGCQKTSNRKHIQKRKRKRTLVEDELGDNEVASRPLNDPPQVSKISPKSSAWIDRCPYPSCAYGPFVKIQDYLFHKAAHEASIFKALAWKGPSLPSACDLKEYLCLLFKHTGAEVKSMRPDLYHRVFQRDLSSITQLDVLECLEVLLDIRHELPRHLDSLTDVDICSIKAIVTGEVDFDGAKRSLELLFKAIGVFFNDSDQGSESGYPIVIEWLCPLMLAWKDWQYIKCNLNVLKEYSQILPPFDKYIPTFPIQKYIRWLKNECIPVPTSFDMEILAICEDIDISLDIEYFSIVQKLPREPESLSPSLRNSVCDIPNHSWPSQVTEATNHNCCLRLSPSEPPSTPSYSTNEEAPSTPDYNHAFSLTDLEPCPPVDGVDIENAWGKSLREKRICPYPECAELVEDLKTHLITHQDDHIQKCDYHIKSFAIRHDQNQYVLTHFEGPMVCNFCPSGIAFRDKFNSVYTFKQHLITVHAVVPSSKPSDSSVIRHTDRSVGISFDNFGRCPTCLNRFETPQNFYGHLDECVLRITQMLAR